MDDFYVGNCVEVDSRPWSNTSIRVEVSAGIQGNDLKVKWIKNNNNTMMLYQPVKELNNIKRGRVFVIQDKAVSAPQKNMRG